MQEFTWELRGGILCLCTILPKTLFPMTFHREIKLEFLFSHITFQSKENLLIVFKPYFLLLLYFYLAIGVFFIFHLQLIYNPIEIFFNQISFINVPYYIPQYYFTLENQRLRNAPTQKHTTLCFSHLYLCIYNVYRFFSFIIFLHRSSRDKILPLLVKRLVYNHKLSGVWIYSHDGKTEINS